MLARPDGRRLYIITANLSERLPWLAPLFLDRSDDFLQANHPKTLRKPRRRLVVADEPGWVSM
jgi:hypothetical protein